MRKVDREIRQMAADEGLSTVEITHAGSGHVKARLREPGGVEFNVFFANSLSDCVRGMKNARCVMKKIHRQAMAMARR